MKTWYAEHLRRIQILVIALTGAACGYLAVGWSHSTVTNIGAAVVLGLVVGLILRMMTNYMVDGDPPPGCEVGDESPGGGE